MSFKRKAVKVKDLLTYNSVRESVRILPRSHTIHYRHYFLNPLHVFLFSSYCLIYYRKCISSKGTFFIRKWIGTSQFRHLTNNRRRLKIFSVYIFFFSLFPWIHRHEFINVLITFTLFTHTFPIVRKWAVRRVLTLSSAFRSRPLVKSW